MKAKRILHTIREEKNKGYKYLYRVRRTLMKALKEYLRQKYGRKVCFILPVGDPLGDLLDERNFYPSSVTVYDKHGYAACSAAVSIELTPEGKIKVSTDESGNIHDAEEYLSYDDLLILCSTIEEYEHLLPVLRREMVESGEWKDHARGLLAEWFPKADAGIIENFIREHWENQQPDDYNLKLFKQSNHSKHGKESI